MKKVFFSKALLLVAVALVGVAIASSCKKEKYKQMTEIGYFVQLKEPGEWIPEVHKKVTAYLYKDSNCNSYPCEIVGEFGCKLPAGYVKGDTIYAETRLEMLYPIEGEICFGIGPYYKLLSIKQINR